MKIAHAANVLLLTALLVYSIREFGSLPERIPVHYGLDGTPDRWVRTTWGAWMLLPAVALILTGLMYGIGVWVGWWGPRHPRWVNVPAKREFLRLPPEDQARLLRAALPLIAWVVVPMNALMLYTQWRGAAVAHGRAEGLGVGFWLLIFAALPVFAILPALRFRRKVLDLAGRRGGSAGEET